MSTSSNLRIHPAIGMARVGNSTEFYLGPETMAAYPGEGALTGGLPIKPGTESTTITSNDIRDAEGKLKRQAARFKIYQYEDGDTYSYPSQKSSEVTIGSVVDGKTVADIIWTVHLANKKANCWEIDEDNNTGIVQYEKGQTPPLRNPSFPPSPDPSAPQRLKNLIVDAGPRSIRGTQGTKIPSYFNSQSGKVVAQPDYPVSFPASNGSTKDYSASSQPIDNLGEIQTEPNGRLLVLGGFGKACGFDNQGNPDPNAVLGKDVDNDNWLDDTADGPVTAVLVFEDGSQRQIEGSAWVVATDPAYAPQTLNIVSLWDDIYNTWLEQFNLDSKVFQNGKYQDSFAPNFQVDVFPVLNAAHMQMWNTNLPDTAIKAHKNVFRLTEQAPTFNIMSFIRNPNIADQTSTGSPLMPLSLGDAAKAFLTVTTTQYFFLEQWVAGKSVGASEQQLTPGEQLDKTILVNCLGGRYSPGIDLTFIVRDPNLYNSNWQDPAIGPFRINAKQLDYSQASLEQPFLGVGYIPLRKDAVEPGDLCKFMAIPWHTDYNSCATHTPDPNPGGALTNENVYSGDVNTSLFWSWPAQRPVAVYTFDDLAASKGELPFQRYSVRGEGTAAVQQTGEGFDTPAMNVGRFQERVNMLINWHRIGTVIQGPAIDGYDPSFPKDVYLEVQSQFEQDDSNLVVAWPNTVTDKVYPPKPQTKEANVSDSIDKK
ncbi:MAG: LodA/GoxA family CTQ-dependent oxidase [Flavobacteriales bacterium]|nr:LodA/GoxA family CTQ-dependent oxidase [Flavobacteriales bacterium]